MNEQQKARIVELGAEAEHMMKMFIRACDVESMDDDELIHYSALSASASAEAFRIAQEARS